MLNKTQCSRFFVTHQILIIVFFFHFNCHAVGGTEKESSKQMQSIINIGVLRNLNSPFGAMINLCIEMANTDFYLANPNYKTRLGLRPKDVEDVLHLDLAVRELLEFEQVHGILGHHGPTQELFVSELGRKTHVPIISFTARSSALSNTENHYFVRTAFDDSVQARALAAICQEFKWKKVVVLYEHSNYGHQFLSHLNMAFQDVEITLARLIPIPASANNTHIHNKLSILKESEMTKVYVVHASASLGSQLFSIAKEIGMVSEGHAWIITDNLSNFLNSIDPASRDSMDGIVGIRPYVPFSEDLENFRKMWKRRSTVPNNINNNNNTGPMDLNVYGLWAYDTVTALAVSVEKIGLVNSSSLYGKTTENTKLRISSFGPQLLRELSNTKIRGLSGNFELVDGKLKPSAFEIFNVFGNGERRLGFWTPGRGIIRDLNSSVVINELRKVVWPGDSVTRPAGWAIPPTASLRVGIPWTRGNTEFVKIESIDDETNEVINATGFAIDIFLAALKKYDMVVGDTTISARRASYVDFSLPYSEPGLILLINNRKGSNMWIFTKPLRWDLWLAIFVTCILVGVVVWILERGVTNPILDERPGMIYLAPIAVLAFQERNIVSNKWSFFILVCWLFMAFILMQSFTANLSAILTLDQLIASPLYIGCKKGSVIISLLRNETRFPPSRLKLYNSLKELHEAMVRGSHNGGIDAIIDETPYMKLFMNRYDPKYKVVGKPSNYKVVRLPYRTEGLGFAFPLGSPLAAYFSRAILNVTQGQEMSFIEQKNFGPGYSSKHPLSSVVSHGTSSLSFNDFAGLFIIVGLATGFAVICSETTILNKLSNITRQLFHSNVDGEIGNHVDNENVASVEVDGDEQHSVEQESPQHSDEDNNVENVGSEIDVVEDFGGEISSSSARTL